VSPERAWEPDGAQRHLKCLFLRHPTPNPCLQNVDGSCVLLQELSMTNLSGAHCLSLQEERGVSKTAVISTVVC
jgi:hypothetical protein